MHDEEGSLCGVGQGNLFREEAEVRHGMGVVILDSVGVQADEMDIACLK